MLCRLLIRVFSSDLSQRSGRDALAGGSGRVCDAWLFKREERAVNDYWTQVDPDFARPVQAASDVLPMGVPAMCVHGTADDDVPVSQSQRFVAAARRAGHDSRLLVLPGTDHYSLIDVTSPAWAACRTVVLELAR